MRIKVKMFFVFLSLSTLLFSQDAPLFTKLQAYKHDALFMKHGVDLGQYDFESTEVNQKILESLKWSRKKETYAVVGVVSLIGGLAGMALAFKEFDSVPLFEAGVGLSALALPSFIISGIQARKAKKSFAALRTLLIQ